MAPFGLNRFHILLFVTWQLIHFFHNQMLFPIFGAYAPRWRCSSSSLINNGTFAKDCAVYKACDGKIEFENSPFYSYALEYGWLCGGNSYLKHLASQIQFGGVLVGTIFWGGLSDMLGRKPICIIALTLGLFTLGLTSIIPNWQLLLASKGLLGLCIGSSTVVFTFVMEMLTAEQRMPLRTFMNCGISRLLLTTACFLFPTWRSASLACAVMVLPALFILAALPESPLWLHSKDRLEDMRNSERWIARMAGTEYVEVKHEEIGKKHSLWRVVKDPPLLKRISVLWMIWFVASISQYTVDLNSGNIVGDLFTNQVLFSVILILSKWALLAMDTLMPSFNRRTLHQYSQGMVIVCFLVLTALSLLHLRDIPILVVNLLGIVAIECTWDVCYLSVVEGMPTETRATALGSSSLFARVGAILAPMLVHLNSTWPSSAYVAVSGLGAFCLIISYAFLHETKGSDLDVVDVEEEEEEAEDGEKLSGSSIECPLTLTMDNDIKK